MVYHSGKMNRNKNSKDMDIISAVYTVFVVLFCVIAIINIVISILRYRKNNVDEYMKQKKDRKEMFLNGK